MSRRGLEAFKFGLYLIVPIGAAAIITIPSIRRKVLSDLYPQEEERPAQTVYQVEQLRQFAKESQLRKKQ